MAWYDSILSGAVPAAIVLAIGGISGWAMQRGKIMRLEHQVESLEAEATRVETRITHIERNFAKAEDVNKSFMILSDNLKSLHTDITTLREEIRADSREMRTAMTSLTYEAANLWKITSMPQSGEGPCAPSPPRRYRKNSDDLA